MSRIQGLTEIRLHGRGGQGVVFAATAIAEAAYREGRYVQSFGIYGAERRGAPVTAFVRVGVQPQMPRCQIQRPDIVVSFDIKLPKEQVLRGIKENGLLLVNCADSGKLHHLCNGHNFEVRYVDAAAIALQNGLAGVGIPMINTAMLGAVVKVSGVCTLESLQAVLREKMPRHSEKNLKAALEGYAGVKELVCYAAAL